ncbi:AraC family transcriptional regulator [Verrucomicrobiaceae bacterium 5K15]|uniref:AraC family transcriptional regulator n=1 Tax=Oceaniferula flava TaxID=2800421 RepID=A0AAE2SAP4_9BACT|nr:AraC family transcriptional regulator [Oceaniferula flavus]MBK1854641.1 AraC family transcriptional regulator [Oceaniferula flavus]MBM1135947.1 AraC family transcriptional regulator [Oceaniferula flavus]
MSRRDDFLKILDTPMVAEQLFAEVPDIVFCMKDLNGYYISVNPAFALRLGVASVDQIIDKTASEIFPPHLAAVYEEQDKNVLEKGEEIKNRLELNFNPHGREGWYLATKIPLFDVDKNIIGLASISRDLLTPSDTDLRFAGVAQVVDTIQRGYSEEISTSDLAKQADLNLTQLDRRMRKVFKVSTSQFIRKIRIENAARMLAITDKPIIEIALDCGYGDQSAFTRQFRATVGMAPGAYRAAATK